MQKIKWCQSYLAQYLWRVLCARWIYEEHLACFLEIDHHDLWKLNLLFRVFHWPKDMAAVFDLAKTRIGNKRDQVEDALRERVDRFETKVGSLRNMWRILSPKNIICEGEQSQQGPGPVHEEGPSCAHHGRDENQLQPHWQVRQLVYRISPTIFNIWIVFKILQCQERYLLSFSTPTDQISFSVGQKRNNDYIKRLLFSAIVACKYGT